ncbi:MAG: LamG domain-containing protein [Phycisphaerae bacterium]|nr:LamG domain-containing protein [Phycisphaerae bacterium]
MNKKILICAVLASVGAMLASTALGGSVVVGDFEGGLDGWRAGDGMTLSSSATGATVGAQALQIDGPGGWHIATLLDARAQMAALANKGVKITADVTVVAADMTTTWMQVGMVVNAQNNDNNGTNNNLGWNDLGSQDVAMDGQPHTYTWVLSDALVGKIAGADDSIGWFELALISNLDGASATKFYVDNIQVVSEEPSESILVSSFEGGFDGWYTDTWTAGTVSLSATGATAGAQAMQVDGPGGWQQLTKANVKPHMATLATPGVKITADVTAFPADMTTTWMQVGMVINCQNNDDNGANNNLGWNELGSQDITLDGQSHTLTWTLSNDLTTKIAGADESIGWFEFLLITNVDGASVARFYIDNIQITGVAAETGKSTDVIIGDWEQSMDGWVVGGGADVLFNDHNGVTLNSYSLDVWVENGAWNTDILTLNLLDPNQSAVLGAFKTNTKISADITRLVADWPTDDIPRWNEMLLVINAGGDGWSLWQLLGKLANWRQPDGDRTITATWDYGPYVSQMDFDKLTWCELHLGINANDETYTGPVWFYIDNMRLSGGGIPLNPQPANGAKDVYVDTLLSWTAGAFAAWHNLYLGTSSGAVVGADGDSDPSVLFASVDGTSFDPNSLEFNTLYFWRVDAVNDVNPDSPWVSRTWSFTTANFLLVDGFETYTDDEAGGGTIYQTWGDGYNDPDNGSQVGYFSAPFTEQTIVRTGGNSMPLDYNNVEAAVSTAVRTWAEPQDWTVNGFNAMKLYIQGKTDNTADQLFVTVADAAGASATVVSDNTAAVTTEAWTEWVIPQADFTGVNMAAVTEMTIGIGSEGNPSGAKGLLFIDDILIGFTPVGLVASYSFDGDIADGSGNGHDGVLAGDANYPATFVSGPTGLGQAMLFDGTDNHQYVSLGTFNPSAATGQLSLSLWAKWDGPSTSWQGMIGKRNAGNWEASIMMWYFELERDVWDVRFVQPGSGLNTGKTLEVGQWTHLAVTFDGTTGKVYFNGEVALEGAFSFGEDKTAPMQIGASVDGGGNPFNGALDDVRIYDKALSADEVKAMMTP